MMTLLNKNRKTNKTNVLFGSFIILLVMLFLLTVFDNKTEQRIVLLSFDVEPVDGAESVSEIIDILEKQNISATFFVTGEYAEMFPDAVRRMQKHEIASHGYSHKAFTKMNLSEKEAEIKRTEEILENVSGKKVLGFRAPYNRIDKETMMILEKEKYVYDASVIDVFGFFYPKTDVFDIGEMPVSSFALIPLEDVVWIYYLNMPSLYFYILENKNSGFESYLFHPHHIINEKERFNLFINRLKKENTTFISHIELAEMHGGV